MAAVAARRSAVKHGATRQRSRHTTQHNTTQQHHTVMRARATQTRSLQSSALRPMRSVISQARSSVERRAGVSHGGHAPARVAFITQKPLEMAPVLSTSSWLRAAARPSSSIRSPLCACTRAMCVRSRACPLTDPARETILCVCVLFRDRAAQTRVDKCHMHTCCSWLYLLRRVGRGGHTLIQTAAAAAVTAARHESKGRS
jgi:hypothetical protein